jgi:hypothetical protein
VINTLSVYPEYFVFLITFKVKKALHCLKWMIKITTYIYMNEILVKWIQIYTKTINLPTSKKINTLIFADDHVIIDGSEDNLQRGILTL